MKKIIILGSALFMFASTNLFGQESQVEEQESQVEEKETQVKSQDPQIENQEPLAGDDVNELDEVVISDSKFALKKEQSGKVITKITSEELERSQGLSLATVLTQASGIFINGSGSVAGQGLGVYARGGRSRQVVIKIDGATVSDPSATSGEFDLRLLAISQIQEIEILKGASSTLYGSGAATAVINITTKPESKKKFAANFQSSLGSNQSVEDQNCRVNELINRASFNGTLGKFSYLASISNFFSDGMSAIELEDAESDVFSKFNAYAKLGYRPNDHFKFHIYGGQDKFRNDFDEGGVDTDSQFESEQLRLGSLWEYSYKNGSLTINQSFAQVNRDFLNSNFPTTYEGDTHTYDVYNKYTFGKNLHTVIGVNGSTSTMSASTIPWGINGLQELIMPTEAKFDIYDPYLNVVFTSDIGFNLNVGGRYNIHSEYDNQFVVSLNPSFTAKISDNAYIKALASYSTSYITPSLFQLFDANMFFTGNESLNPEEGETIEWGLEFKLNKNSEVSAVYFNRESKNYITFDPVSFVNINAENTINVDGVEAQFSTKLFNDKVMISGNYTYTDISKLEDNIRIPRHMGNASLGYAMTKNTMATLSYQINSKRLDTDFSTFSQVELSEFDLLNFHISHQLSKNVKVFAAVTNITNEDYQEIYGFETRGRNVRGGISLDF